jgi:hypothetical protein
MVANDVQALPTILVWQDNCLCFSKQISGQLCHCRTGRLKPARLLRKSTGCPDVGQYDERANISRDDSKDLKIRTAETR